MGKPMEEEHTLFAKGIMGSELNVGVECDSLNELSLRIDGVLMLQQDARVAQGANLPYGLLTWDDGLGGCNTDGNIGAGVSCQRGQNIIIG